MKSTLCIAAIAAGSLFANNLLAQDILKKEPKKDHKHDILTISNKGIKLEEGDSTGKHVAKEQKEKRFSSSVALFDIGVNMLQDNTNYSAASSGTGTGIVPTSGVANLNVPANRQNTNLFDLRAAKSINVNIYPFMEKFRALKTPGQRIFISTGLGLQIYNFRYENPITYTKDPSTIILDTISFKKNKLAVNYLNVPLMLTFKTRFYKDPKRKAKNDGWLVYGVGITEGMRLNSWTKQVSKERGKVKEHDTYGMANFNTCVSAEFGVEGIFRLFASYQLTSLYNNGLDQHPISIGLRFSGI